MIDIIEKEPIIGHVNEFDAILVGTNCYQVMRNGFQLEIAKKFPFVKEMNNSTKYGDPNKLGTIVECKKDGFPTIILMFISFGYNFKGSDDEYIDYDALRKCLKLINIVYGGKRIASSMIGCTFFDGNGIQDKVLGIINKEVTSFDLTMFDYQQKTYEEYKKDEFEKKKLLKKKE